MHDNIKSRQVFKLLVGIMLPWDPSLGFFMEVTGRFTTLILDGGSWRDSFGQLASGLRWLKI